MVDIEQVIYDAISDSSSVMALIGSNLFTHQAHDFNGGTEVGLTFNIRSGINAPLTPLHEVVVDIRIFSGANDWEDARSIYRTLHDALHGVTNLSVDSGFIIKAEETGTGTNLIEPDTQWYLVLTTYNFLIRGNS